jgi:hypothetical protein
MLLILILTCDIIGIGGHDEETENTNSTSNRTF